MIFQKGESYFATPTIKGGAQKIVTVVARNAGRVSFSASEALSQERVSVFDGREIARRAVFFVEEVRDAENQRQTRRSSGVLHGRHPPRLGSCRTAKLKPIKP